MSGFAVVIEWNGPQRGDDAATMLRAMAHRGTDAMEVDRDGSAAFGFALHATRARDRAIRQPFHDVERGIWFVGDVRIDNREEIVDALGMRAIDSDAALLTRSYSKWREEMTDRLVGDFAFAIWDTTSRSLYAARDAFGIRPLFYAEHGSKLFVASEVEAILATGAIPRTLDTLHLAEFASASISDATRTMFSAVRRLPMGHALVTNSSRVRTQRWFRYPTMSPPADERADLRSFRGILLRAVSDRLDADATIVSQLSGGIDSASIACAADVLRRERRLPLPDVVLASATYPGLSCDETREIDAVIGRTGFTHTRWRWDDPAIDLVEPIYASLPWRDMQPGSGSHALTIAASLGSRVVITGNGGDELLHENGAFVDLARHGRFVRLFRETLGSDLYLSQPRRTYFENAIRAAIPAPIRRARQWLRRPSKRVPTHPDWFGPALAAAWREREIPSVERLATQEVSRLTWSWLQSPAGGVHRDLDELQAARRGIELRHPYFDRRLAALVLSIPWERRLPGGRMKRLVRDAMADELPPLVAQRTRVTTFEPAVVRAVLSQLASLRNAIDGREWVSGDFIDRTVAREMLARVHTAGTSATYGDCYDLWSIASIELWNRAREKGYGES